MWWCCSNGSQEPSDVVVTKPSWTRPCCNSSESEFADILVSKPISTHRDPAPVSVVQQANHEESTPHREQLYHPDGANAMHSIVTTPRAAHASANEQTIEASPITSFDLQGSPEKGNAHEFCVELEKHPGQKLGVDAQSHDTKFLKLLSINDGPVNNWNQHNPEALICPGDLVIEAGGVSGDVQSLLGALNSKGKITLRIRRPAEQLNGE